MRKIIIFTTFIAILATFCAATPVSACPGGYRPCGGACCPGG